MYENLYILVGLLRQRAAVAQSVYRVGYGLDDRGSNPGGGNSGIFSLRHPIQIALGVNLASYAMGKAAGGWSWPLTTHLHLMPRLRMCGDTPPLTQYLFMW
jgi:hypothetical protein